MRQLTNRQIFVGIVAIHLRRLLGKPHLSGARGRKKALGKKPSQLIQVWRTKIPFNIISHLAADSFRCPIRRYIIQLFQLSCAESRG